MRRLLHLALSLLAFSILTPSIASAEYMTEAERREQRTALWDQNDREVLSDTREGSGFSIREEGEGVRYPLATAEYENAFPDETPGTIVIETRERVLHYIVNEETMITYPIAVGKEGAQWAGTTRVIGKKQNPEWRPTPNMRKKNPKLPALVKPGPSNPLGVRAIYLAEGYLRIHGTNAPDSIGKAASSGCYRMHNEDVMDLYERVSSGASVKVLR